MSKVKNIVVAGDYAYVEGGAARMGINTAILLSRYTDYRVIFFGGVPAFVIPDNCATAVDRQHFDEKGILNTRYVEFLNHYGAIPKPTRIQKPRDKGHVERHVRIVEDDIYSPEAAELASEAALASSVFTVKGFKSILGAQARLHPAKETRVDLNDIFCAHDEEGSENGNL